MKLSVVIVNYNVKHYLEQCLLSLRKALEGIDAEVLVVDNHSSDGSVEYLRERFHWVHFVASRHNLGFARANNLAIRMSKSDYVLLLNPDTLVAENTLHEVVAWMDSHADAGSLGVRMLNACGESARESRRGVPTPMVAFWKMMGLCDRMPSHRRFGHYYMGYLDWDVPASIEVVSGAFCLLRREALDKVGLLDEDFFMYGEDIDLSYRVLKGGYRNYYLPSLILHYKGESTQKSSFRYVHVFYEAMLIFFRKHNSGMSLLLTVPISAAIYARASIAAFSMLVSKMRKSLGFTPRRKASPHYIFLGGQEMLDVCRNISFENGLDAQFVLADAARMPEGHLSATVQALLQTMGKSIVYIVYDMGAYHYQQLMELFKKDPHQQWRIGTYHAATRKVVTEHDVIS